MIKASEAESFKSFTIPNGTVMYKISNSSTLYDHVTVVTRNTDQRGLIHKDTIVEYYYND